MQTHLCAEAAGAAGRALGSRARASLSTSVNWDKMVPTLSRTQQNCYMHSHAHGEHAVSQSCDGEVGGGSLQTPGRWVGTAPERVGTACAVSPAADALSPRGSSIRRPLRLYHSSQVTCAGPTCRWLHDLHPWQGLSHMQRPLYHRASTRGFPTNSPWAVSPGSICSHLLCPLLALSTAHGAP